MVRSAAILDRLVRQLVLLAVLVAPATALAGELAAPAAAPLALVAPPVADVLAAAAAIDRLVERDLSRQGLALRPLTDDATFVRRVHLDVVGRIPTLEESRAFLSSDDPHRRRRLIDELLASPGHGSHLFNWWADLLRVKTKLARYTSGEPYAAYLKQVIADNVPYDEVVTELLTASGAAHARDNGATGYLLRDREMPEDNMANTARVFLGTRLECAQCHNHPYLPWTQKQFFEMVAFSGGIGYEHAAGVLAEDKRALRDVRDQIKEESGQQAARQLRRVVRPASSGISGSGTGAVRLPHDYAYEDADPEALVQARTLFGEAVDLPAPQPEDAASNVASNEGLSRRERRRAERERKRKAKSGPPEIGSRELYADWLTSPDNPRFTTVIANRMWKRVMGRGLIEPVDDLREDTGASHPALMTLLEGLMVDLGYDLRDYERVLLNTRVYQAQASSSDPEPDELYLFAGPLLRRMTAEQVWDSLLTLVVEDLDGTLGKNATVDEVWADYEELVELDADGLRQRVDERAMRFTDPERFEEQRAEKRAGRRQAGALRRKLSRATRKGNDALADEARDELLALGLDPDDRPVDRKLVRASDLPSPAPSGHLLWRFGQSDREQIEASHTDANVPQVLSLLNGFVETHLLARDTGVLRTALRRSGRRDAGVDTAFAAILTRAPSADELALWTEHIADRGRSAFRDLIWTLLNTHEFLFVQ